MHTYIHVHSTLSWKHHNHNEYTKFTLPWRRHNLTVTGTLLNIFLGEYLGDFDVHVGSTNPVTETGLDTTGYTLCQHYAGDVAAGQRVVLECSVPTVARYVSVQKSDTTALQLCEVQVYTEIGKINTGNPKLTKKYLGLHGKISNSVNCICVVQRRKLECDTKVSP